MSEERTLLALWCPCKVSTICQFLLSRLITCPDGEEYKILLTNRLMGEPKGRAFRFETVDA